ncbi:50S ribosomal protein L11 [Candidatus Micrarchaeota archaeon]|nr:50S ribosomal protein L11 [Candidatus Micrarchaeota archaeon]
MAKVTISALVEGGAATAGPPLGPALGPLGVNINEIISTINEKTKDFKGIKVPVKVIVDKESKTFDIEIGTPPTSELIKKEIGVTKGRKEPGEIVGDISLEQVIKIAKIKRDKMRAKSLKSAVKQVLGTCVSLGATCNGKDPREIIREIDEGKHDTILAE